MLALLHVKVRPLGRVLALALPVARVHAALAAVAPLLPVGRLGEELREVGEALQVLLKGLQVRRHERVEARKVEAGEAGGEARHSRMGEAWGELGEPCRWFTGSLLDRRLLREDRGDGGGVHAQIWSRMGSSIVL